MAVTRAGQLRPDLHRYCRRLTGNVWDAEDLLQETLTRAFTAAAQAHQPIDKSAGLAGEPLEDALRVDTADGGVQRLRWYYLCPETLTELAGHWDVPVRTNGYGQG